MPKREVKQRGGSIRTRTKVLKTDSQGRTVKYMRCEVVRKEGKRGGRTVCGPVHTVKRKRR